MNDIKILNATIGLLQSIQGQNYNGCINHDIVVGLCSELQPWSIGKADDSQSIGPGFDYWNSWKAFALPSRILDVCCRITS